MLVTTAYNPTYTAEQRAQKIATKLHAQLVKREKHSFNRLRSRYGASDILVVTDDAIRYFAFGHDDALPLTFHPNMAALRLKRLNSGQLDSLLNLSEVRKGEAILDCTAGMASDAIVFAHAVGPTGSVTALESDPILALIVREGLATYESDIPGLTAAMRRVNLLTIDHATYLKQLPDKSYDVIYFDPMFRAPHSQSAAIEPLRTVANHAPLSEATISEARRVSRRCIIMKEHRYSGEFARLGFTIDEQRIYAKITYGVIHL